MDEKFEEAKRIAEDLLLRCCKAQAIIESARYCGHNCEACDAWNKEVAAWLTEMYEWRKCHDA